MATIYCMNCGAELDERARFCTECGCLTSYGARTVNVRLSDGPTFVRDLPGERSTGDDAMPRARQGSQDDPTSRQRGETTPVASREREAARFSHVRRLREREFNRTLTIGIISALALLAILVGAGFGSGLFGRVGSSTPWSQDDSQVVSDPAQTGVPASLGSAGTEVRASLDQYSWSELSIIAHEMSGAGSREAAIEIAKEYHLADEDGHMVRAYKDVVIDGVGTVTVRLVDVYHDNLANGEGKAGMSFLAANLPISHRMKERDDNIGGWEGTEMRAWLNGQVYEALDEELRPCVVAVDKLTDNVGKTMSTDSVTSTIDYLWIPSAVELCGPITWTWDSDVANSSAYNAVLNAEGFQYARFAEQNVPQTDANGALLLKNGDVPIAWWMRSCSASKDAHYRIVEADGNPSRYGAAPDSLGVCLGFCL